MANISIDAPLVNGSLMPYIEEGMPCKAAVELITGDDLRPPARNVTISVLTASGKRVQLFIPNSANDSAIVRIDGEVI